MVEYKRRLWHNCYTLIRSSLEEGFVGNRISAIHLQQKQPTRRIQRLKPAFITILLALSLLTGALFVPGVRAAVLEFIQIGVIRIFIPSPTTTPTPRPLDSVTVVPTILPTQPALDYLPLGQIAGETTLEQAIDSVNFSLSLPDYPPELGKPDRIFIQDQAGTLVVLVWSSPDNPDRAELILYEIAPGAWMAEKGVHNSIQSTTVNGQEALWADGPYILYLKNGNQEYHRLVTGHVLIWFENDITYRLVCNLPLDEAIQIAESLEPIRKPNN